jgi:hypothetical protein
LTLPLTDIAVAQTVLENCLDNSELHAGDEEEDFIAPDDVQIK